MERYHMFKLGLAILFYAAYCIRPMMVNGLEAEDFAQNHKNNTEPRPNPHDFLIYYQGVEGKPGVDFPVYSFIPRTTFSCQELESGYYADLDTDCQVFHICEDGKKISFLCPNGTIFQQSDLICEWWFKVNCSDAPSLYSDSAEHLRNDMARRKASRKVLNGNEVSHGAIMRTEEARTVTASKNGQKFHVKNEEYHVNQAITGGKKIDNRKIPQGNDLDQSERVEESNNRHLANAQRNYYQIQEKDKSRNKDNTNNGFGQRKRQRVDKSFDNTPNNNFEQNYKTTAVSSNINNNQNQPSTHNNINQNNYSPKESSGTQNGFGVKDIQTDIYKSPTARPQNVEEPTFTTKQNTYNTKESYQSPTTPSYTNYNQNYQHSANTEAAKKRDDESGQQSNLNNQFANQQTRTTLRDYHVQFSSTGSNFETTTKPSNHYSTAYQPLNSVSTTIRPFSSSTFNSLNYDTEKKSGPFGGGNVKYNFNGFNDREHPSIVESSTKVPVFSSTYVPHGSTYGNKVGISSTPKPIVASTLNIVDYSGQKTSGTVNRGSIKYNSNGSTLDATTKSVPVFSTTVSPFTARPRTGVSTTPGYPANHPNNFNDSNSTADEGTTAFNFKTFSQQSSQLNTENIAKLPDFPRHKSEEFNGDSKLKDQNSSSDGVSDSIIPRKDTTNIIDESQITQESSSFVKNPFNSLSDNSKNNPNSFVNHKPTYSEVKSPNSITTTTGKFNGISSITPQFVTTQPINNGKPFLGSRVGTTVTSSSTTAAPQSNQDSSKETIIVGVLRHSPTTPEYGPPVTKSEKELFNVGNVKNLPHQVETKQPIDINNPLPAEKFNTGSTDFTVSPKLVLKKEKSTVSPTYIKVPPAGSFNKAPVSTRFNVGTADRTLPTVIASSVNPLHQKSSISTTVPPFNINVPELGSLNLGLNTTDDNLVPVIEPEVTKKFVSLLYPSTKSPLETTSRTVDHATVYGTVTGGVSTTATPFVTQPRNSKVTVEVTKSISSTPSTFSSFSSSAVPVRFDKNSDRVQIQLSKLLSGTTITPQKNLASNVATFDKNSDKVNLQLTKSVVEPRRKPLLTKPHILSSGNDYVRLSVGSSNSPASPSPNYESTTARVPFIQSTTSGSLSDTTPRWNNPSGFFVTKDNFNEISSAVPNALPTQRPRGFQKSIDFSPNSIDSFNTVTPTFPTYKISSAKPFEAPTTASTFLPPKFSTFDSVDNMINVLMEIAKVKDDNDYSFETPRPGLVVPPSAGPQTLHTLAQYFANALDDIVSDKEEDAKAATKEKISNLLTQMTVHGYNSLFRNRSQVSTTTVPPSVESITLETRLNVDGATKDDDVTPTPELRELARNFSLALSSYLNDPDTFRKNLEDLRPTDPPLLAQEISETNSDNEELLNFSDADTKSSFPPVFPTLPSVSPTWGFIIANTLKDGNYDVKNSLNPDLNTADSQSFVPRYNDVNANDKQSTALPPNHWTRSPDATKLWQKTLSINPEDVNEHFVTSTEPIRVSEDVQGLEDISEPGTLPAADTPLSEVKYELRSLPKLSLNSTQVHGILIDFMNSTKQDESNRLLRILKKLNTSEEEFLTRMKEIESNPITKRLILLLISECGANVTKDLENGQKSPDYLETLKTSSSSGFGFQNSHSEETKSRIPNSNFQTLVDPNLSEEDQDTRALQLLNSLYSIASKFGK